MTNHFIHVTHNKPLYQCTYDKPADPSLPWEIIAIMPPSQTISAKPSMTNHLPIPHMTNHLTQATHDKPFWLCHPWKTLSPYYTHEKKIRPMMSPWETNAIMPPSEILSPIQSRTNHFTHSTMANYFTHATHDNFTCSIPVNHESYSTRTNHSTHATHHKPFHPSNPWHTIYQ